MNKNEILLAFFSVAILAFGLLSIENGIIFTCLGLLDVNYI